MGCGDAGGGSRLPPPFPATLVRGDSIGRGAGTRGAGKEEWATKRCAKGGGKCAHTLGARGVGMGDETAGNGSSREV